MMAAATSSLLNRVLAVADEHGMPFGAADAALQPVVLMVSGGSDSTALAYLAAELRDAGQLGPVTMLHVNHHLRGEDSDGDEAFVRELAQYLAFPLVVRDIDMPALLEGGGNMEAVARAERYRLAAEVLADLRDGLVSPEGAAMPDGLIATAHTADDRIENFYMRSIVGTGPGGLRAMSHVSQVQSLSVCRPLLEETRDSLREYLMALPDAATDETGMRWREDATNFETDRFRTFVRHELVSLAKGRNPQLAKTLTRTMNLIADEDDMLAAQVNGLLAVCMRGLGESPADGFLLLPQLCDQPLPLRRRCLYQVLRTMLPEDERVESRSVDACLNAMGVPGAVANIQHNLVASYNKKGLRIEPMEAFRTRRKM